MNYTPEYYSDWCQYAFNTECEQRFLSLEPDDLLKICDVIDVYAGEQPKLSGYVPVHYEDGKLYVLKEGHTRVAGDTGSKKSRTVVRGSIIASALTGDSMIITDPKGELYEDPKLRHLLDTQGYNVCCLDFRKFDKDALNIIGPAFDLIRRGKVQESDAFIDRFLSMLVESNKGGNIDPFWNNQSAQLLGSIIRSLRNALIQMDDKERFNLSSVLTFIRQERESVERIFAQAVRQSTAVRDPIKIYHDMVNASAERTYSSIVSTTQSLLAPMTSSDALLRMLCCDTLDMASLYNRKTAVFLVVPDESKAFDQLSGYIVNLFYETLLMEFADQYQGRKYPPCNINVIVDEAASIQIHDMASKISAGRSRFINFTIIYQSEKQMALAYKDYGTIVGNCRNYIFLGSTDFDNLRYVSDSLGKSTLSPDSGTAPMVSVDDLRRMRKEKSYKEALVVVGNYILSARLPDYDIYPFLKKELRRAIQTENRLPWRILVYTPEEMAEDYRTGKIRMIGSKPVKKAPRPDKSGSEYLEEALKAKISELFGDDSEDCNGEG